MERRAESLQKQARMWHGKMEQRRKQYDKEGFDVQRMVNTNLKEFGKYLDTLSLHGKFTWVSRHLCCVETEKDDARCQLPPTD